MTRVRALFAQRLDPHAQCWRRSQREAKHLSLPPAEETFDKGSDCRFQSSRFADPVGHFQKITQIR